MISFNEEQKKEIKKLQPLIDSKFKYDKLRWSNLRGADRELIKDFEDKEITRQDVINAYKNYYTDRNNGFMKAFLLTMGWGFADIGYGTYRTNNYISSDENRKKIKTALKYINENKQNSLKKAFKELNSIEVLGVNYSTKILYFATRAKNMGNYALIFDKRVAGGLIKLTTPNEIYEIVAIGPSLKFNKYEKFNKIIHTTARKNNIEADQLEMYLFNQDFE